MLHDAATGCHWSVDPLANASMQRTEMQSLPKGVPLGRNPFGKHRISVLCMLAFACGFTSHLGCVIFDQ